MTRGLVLGKFMPLHAGHMALVRHALARVDELVVVVCSRDCEPIPGRLRRDWMQATFPEARVEWLHKDLPQEPGDSPDFWAIWRAELDAVAQGPVDVVFAGEPYGIRLAHELGARPDILDRRSHGPPVSGTAVRADPHAHWDLIAPAARPWFVKRIALCGAESTGKTTLAAALARHYGTVWVPEHGRTVWEAEGGASLEAMSRIAHGHRRLEEEALPKARRYLFVDTDALTTEWWSRKLHGTVPADVAAMARERRYDLHLLLHPDVPWVQDGTRLFEDERERTTQELRAALAERGWPAVEVAGGWEERMRRAVAAVDRVGAG